MVAEERKTAVQGAHDEGAQKAEGRPARLWTKSFIILTLVNFVSALCFYLLNVKMTEYAFVTYNVTQSVAGATVTAYVVGALVTRIFLGGRIDEWGVRKSLFAGFIINVVMSFVYLIPMGIEPLLVMRFLHGIGFGLAGGAAASGAVMIIPENRRGEGIGYFSMAQALATGIGPFVAILLMNTLGDFSLLFLLCAIACVVALVGLFFVKLPAAANGTGRDPNRPKERISIRTFVQVSVLPLAFVLFMAYLGYAGVLSFMTLYTGEMGLVEASSLYFVVYAIVILVTRPFTGKYVDRKGPNTIIYLSMALLAVGLLLMWQTANITMAFGFVAGAVALLVSAAFIGFGIGNTQSVIQAVIAKITPESQLGKANSTFFMSMDLGSGIGPVLIGAVIPFIGYANSYFWLAIVAVLGLVSYYFTFARTYDAKAAQLKAERAKAAQAAGDGASANAAGANSDSEAGA